MTFYILFRMLNVNRRTLRSQINSLALEFSEYFQKKYMLLLKAPKGHQFFISDNPITMHNHLPRPGRGNLGLALDGIEIHLPISKKLSITFVCPKIIDPIFQKMDNVKLLRMVGISLPIDTSDVEEIINAVESGKPRFLKAENMEFHNSLQVIQSSRFVYSSNDDFSLVEDMLRTNPECMRAPRLQSG